MNFWPRSQLSWPPRDEMEPLNVSVEECAHLLGLGITKTKRLVQTGEILSIKEGRRRLVPMTAIHEWLTERLKEARDERDGHLSRQQRLKRMRQKPA